MPRWIAALRLTGVGFFIGGAIALGVFGGMWADDRLGTRPLFILLGLALGIVAASAGVYRMLLPLLKDKSDKEND